MCSCVFIFNSKFCVCYLLLLLDIYVWLRQIACVWFVRNNKLIGLSILSLCLGVYGRIYIFFLFLVLHGAFKLTNWKCNFIRIFWDERIHFLRSKLASKLKWFLFPEKFVFLSLSLSNFTWKIKPDFSSIYSSFSFLSLSPLPLSVFRTNSPLCIANDKHKNPPETKTKIRKKKYEWILCRRKSTRMKYDPPYTKKPIIKGGAANSNHHSVDEVSLDGSNKLITTYGNTFR